MKYDMSKRDSMLLYVVSKKRNPKMDVDSWLRRFVKANKEYGERYLEDLESEITLSRALIASSLGDYFATDKGKAGVRQWLRREIMQMIDIAQKVVKTNAEVKYGKNYSVKIEEVQEVILAIQQIIMKNVGNPKDLKKIVSELRRTLVLPMQHVKVVN